LVVKGDRKKWVVSTGYWYLLNYYDNESLMESRVKMMQKQLNWYLLIKRSLEGRITVKEAANVLFISFGLGTTR